MCCFSQIVLSIRAGDPVRVQNLSQSNVTLSIDVDGDGANKIWTVGIDDILEIPGLETGSYVLVNATDPNETLQVVVVD